jgi:hypothetical protein
MNEQFKELSEQAEKYADDNFRGEPTWSEAFESKFAELIVRECARIIDEEALEERNDFAMRRIECCSWMIKEHFGVK